MSSISVIEQERAGQYLCHFQTHTVLSEDREPLELMVTDKRTWTRRIPRLRLHYLEVGLHSLVPLPTSQLFSVMRPEVMH